MDDFAMRDSTKTTELKIEKWSRFCLCGLLLAITGYLGKSGWDASWSKFLKFPPSKTAFVWSDVETMTMFASLLSALVALLRRRISVYFSIASSVADLSIYMAQLFLQLLDRASDQTYFLSNSYLSKPVMVPLILCGLSLFVSVARVNMPSAVVALPEDKLREETPQELLSRVLSK